MEDNQIYEVLKSYKDAIDSILDKVDQLEQEKAALAESFTELQKLVVDNLLNPIKEATEDYEREERFSDFEDKYGARFEPYTETMKKVEGDDDYDVTRDAFDQYEQMPEPRPEEGDYVDQVLQGVEERVNAIKEVFGITDDQKVETVTEDGKTEVKVDGEKIAEMEDGEVKTDVPEEGDKEVVEETEEEETIDDPAEIEEYEKKLREEIF